MSFPRIVVADRANELFTEDPVTIQDRLRFVIYADEYFAASLSADDLGFAQNFHELERFEQRRIWRSITDNAAYERNSWAFASNAGHYVRAQR
jgi:hypothetical protein